MERRVCLIFMVGFFVLSACQTSPQPKNILLNCQAQSYYACEKRQCKKESVSSVYIQFENSKAEVGMYSLITNDPSPRLISKNGKKYFLIHSTGKAVGGELVEVSAVGEISKDRSFDALIDGVHYKGLCKKR